jgi:hypothetical protein
MAGSNIYFSGKWKSQQFTASGSFTVPDRVTQVFVEMYGAGGGGSKGAITDFGGAAGQYVVAPVTVTGGANVSITIGSGGAGATSTGDGADGGDTSFGTVVARGGKGGRHVTAFGASMDVAEFIGSNKNVRLPMGGVYGSAGTNSGPFDGLSSSAAGGDGAYGNGGNFGSGVSGGGDGGIGAGGGAMSSGTADAGDGGDGICIVYYKVD